MVNYLKLRPNNLTSPEFRHLLLLIFWPVFGLFFAAVEQWIPRDFYYPVYCPLDDLIPFNELFMIPYMFWFVFLVGAIVYVLLFDVPAFRRMMYFVFFTYGVTMITYLVWPTCQELRPTEFARDNFLTRFIADFYAFDTNTNVCPSLHVVGSFVAAFGCIDTRFFRKWYWILAFLGMAFLISFSTVFVKQHSIIDVFAALALCLVGYVLVYVVPVLVKKRKSVKK